MDTKKTGPRSSLLRVLKGERCSPPPLWLMRQAGRYLPEYQDVRRQAGGFLGLCYDPALACEVTLQPVRRFDLDAAILFSDILVIPHAMGCDLRFAEGEGPVMTPVGAATMDALKHEGAIERLTPVYEAVGRIRAELAPEKALIGFAGAPWTIACYMVEGGASKDFAAVKGWLWRDPAGFGVLIDRLVDLIAAHLKAQVAAGVDCVQIFDSWAGVLPEREFRQWSIDPIRRIVNEVKYAYPEVPVIGFPRGAGGLYEGFAQGSGCDAVGLDYTVSDEISLDVQRRVPVQGNLDPVLLVEGGDALETRVQEILELFSGGPHVFNLGHGVLPRTPPENVARLVEIVRRESGR